MPECYLEAIVGHQPARLVSNEDLAAANPGWNAARLSAKTGIDRRPTVAPGETASDLAVVAARKLFTRTGVDPGAIDTLIFVSQSPDHLLPATACVLQHRLGLPDTVAAFDVNLGCSALPYAFWLARGLVTSGSARKVLVLFGETYTRYCAPDDLTTVTLFSDGAAAALIGTDAGRALARVGPSRLGTDGSGGSALIVEAGGARAAAEGRPLQPPRLKMDGAEVFRFALDRVKPQVEGLLGELGLGFDSIDRFFLHQANRFMLDALRTKLGVAAERLPIDLADVGNAACASLPILLARQLEQRAIAPGCRSLAIGFGVGLSWGTTYLEWLRP